MRSKVQNPHHEGAKRYQPPIGRKNKAINVPLVSACVYPPSAQSRNSALNADRLRDV